MKETWKKIEGCLSYEISNHGNVRHCKHKKNRKFSVDKDGYYKITLLTGLKTQRTYRPHRLVAITFLPNKNNLYIVDHINHVRTDNRVSNLRWVSLETNNMNRLRCSMRIVDRVIKLYKDGYTKEDIYNDVNSESGGLVW